jgi:hypothetical protein
VILPNTRWNFDATPLHEWKGNPVFVHRVHRQYVQEELNSLDETCSGISGRIHRHGSDVPEVIPDRLVNVVPAL